MDDDGLRTLRALLAPGTPLREGLERIVHGRTGALVVLGESEQLRQLCTGGFGIDTEFTAQALRELAKMDGAVVLAGGLGRIARAGVHLMPDASVPTDETGTRHRTADRVSRQTGLPVVTVSASMGTIALYVDGVRHPVQRPEQILTRANQALATLARYRNRLDEATARLSALEIRDQVRVADLVLVAQRLELHLRLAEEIDDYIASLGVDGRLVELQLHELRAGLEELPSLIELDYSAGGHQLNLEALRACSTTELMIPEAAAELLSFGADTPLNSPLGARGHRQLASVARLPRRTSTAIVVHFDGLQELLGATIAELRAVDDVDDNTARIVKDALLRLDQEA